METNLSDFISAGFIVTQEVDRPPYVSTELLPARIVSVSGCIAPFVPDTWCIEWTQDAQDSRIEEAEKFGLNSQKLKEITEWTTSRFDMSIRWPNVVSGLETAEELVRRFFSSLPAVKILELCLHQSMFQNFCQEAEPPQPKPGYAPNGRQGVHEVILVDRPPNQNGHILGFEPLVFDYALSFSWLCNGIDAEVEKALGIKPNKHGMIGSFDDAS